MAKILKKKKPSVSYTDRAVEVLHKVIRKQITLYNLSTNTAGKILRNFTLGMRSKAARAKDRKYTSAEKHEKKYATKRKSPVVKYKKK